MAKLTTLSRGPWHTVAESEHQIDVVAKGSVRGRRYLKRRRARSTGKTTRVRRLKEWCPQYIVGRYEISQFGEKNSTSAIRSSR